MRIVEPPDFPRDHQWPVTLRYGRLLLTPFHRRDLDEVTTLRSRNVSWLSPWDATSPSLMGAMVTAEKRVRSAWTLARKGYALPWLIRWHEQDSCPVIGQCTVSNIVYGSAMYGSIGYWIDRQYAGRSITPAAVALATDYAMRTVGLHRIEICIRPENKASLRVVEKLRMRYEGRRPRYIHIAGAWRDHEVFAVTTEEVSSGLLARVPHDQLGKPAAIPPGRSSGF